MQLGWWVGWRGSLLIQERGERKFKPHQKGRAELFQPRRNDKGTHRLRGPRICSRSQSKHWLPKGAATQARTVIKLTTRFILQSSKRSNLMQGWVEKNNNK